MDIPYHHTSPVSIADIAGRLGLRKYGHEWRGACPSCGYRAALIVTERLGRTLWHCVSCNDKAGVTAAIKAALGGLPIIPEARPERLPRAVPADPAARRARAEALWNGAERITPDCAAGRYLERRGIAAVAASPALRWRRDCPHPGGGRRLAMLCRIDVPDGTFAGVQRIFVAMDGTKAAIEPAKASLGTVAGGACRLAAPVDGALVIGEGVETAAAAGALLRLPAWCAVSAGNMARTMQLPPDVRTVTVCADNDPPGLAAAEAAARRWRQEGRSVRIVRASAEGADAADVIAAGNVP
jgi:putative DNA primase/helicase